MNAKIFHEGEEISLISALKKVEFTSFQLLQTIAVVLQFSIRTINLTVNYYMIPIKNFFALDDFSQQMFLTMFHLGRLFGNLAISLFVRFLNRKTYLISHSIALSALLLTQTFAVDPIVLHLSRFFIGFEVSLLTPIPMNALMENIPTDQRGKFNTVVNLLDHAVCLAFSILILLVMPNYEIGNLKYVFCSIFALSLMTTCLYIFWEDSVRSLIINGEENRALYQLDMMFDEKCGLTLSRKERQTIVHKLKLELAQISNERDSFEFLFTKDMWSTVLLSLTYFLLGLAICFPTIVNLLSEKWGYKSNEMVVTNAVNEVVICLCIFISKYLLDLECLGRKLTVVVSLLLGLIPTVTMYYCSGFLMISYTVFIGIRLVSIITFYIFIVEIYHTKIRDQAVGFYSSMYSLGNILSSFLFYYGYGISDFIPFATQFLLIVLSLLVYFVPYETLGKDLD